MSLQQVWHMGVQMASFGPLALGNIFAIDTKNPRLKNL
jgi:hypothetical protein